MYTNMAGKLSGTLGNNLFCWAFPLVSNPDFIQIFCYEVQFLYSLKFQKLKGSFAYSRLQSTPQFSNGTFFLLNIQKEMLLDIISADVYNATNASFKLKGFLHFFNVNMLRDFWRQLATRDFI